jgi:beta-1,4-mannosyltransferase
MADVASVSSRTRLRVLQSFFEPDAAPNPYTDLLARSMPPDVDSRYFSWRRAIRADYDVVNIQWPEMLVRTSSRLSTYRNLAAVLYLITRWRVRKVGVVRTLHEEQPHEAGGALERFVLRRLEKSTHVWIKLVPQTADRPPRTFLIPHGDYRPWYRRPVEVSFREDSLAFVGRIREYKGVLALLAAWRGLDGATAPGGSLHIVGTPNPPSLGDEVAAAAQGLEGVDLRLEAVDDDEFVREVMAAEAVVMPYRYIVNSGVALAALSLNRPIIATDTDVTRDLREEVGHAWVHLIPEPITRAALAEAIDWLRTTRSERHDATPDLEARSWDRIGEQHRDAYLTARRLARGGVVKRPTPEQQALPSAAVPEDDAEVVVSVVIPTFNPGKLLGAQLDSLAAQDFEQPWELIIADNGSTDASLDDIVEGYSNRLRLRFIDASDERGPGHARNAGAAAARGEWLAFCDADDVASPGWLSALYAARQQGGLITGPLDVGRLNSDANINARGGVRVVDTLPNGLRGLMPMAVTSNLFVAAEVFHALQGFDTQLRAGEDVDFSWRAQLAGHRIVLAPGAVMFYRYRTTPWGAFRQSRGYRVYEGGLFERYRDRGLELYPLREIVDRLRWVIPRLPFLAMDEEHRFMIAYHGGDLLGVLQSRAIQLPWPALMPRRFRRTKDTK